MPEIINTLHEEFVDRINHLESIVARNIVCKEVPNKISVILGMRRVGKTYLMFDKIKQLINYIMI